MASTQAGADLPRNLVPLVVIVMALLLAVLAGLGLRSAFAPASQASGRSAAIPASRLPDLPRLAAPPTPAPPVEPTIIKQISRDDAKASNDAVPIVAGPLPAARPFVFAGTPFDRNAARTCLAAAVLYEAGDDREGEEAVAQVILNRLRHPAFPKTVCGVVFQGSQRTDGSGGCQFTFTCDGALDRAPLLAAWKRAGEVADAALSGEVYKAVGTATHYHANYVVPFWRDSLDKIAQVGAHIFYRWKGYWGTPAAFTGRPQPLEQLDPRIVALAGPGQVAMPTETAGLVTEGDMAGVTGPAAAAGPPKAIQIPGIGSGELNGAVVRLTDADAAQFVVQYDPEAAPDTFAMLAVRLCAKRADCLVFGWTSAAQMPRSLPLMPMGMRGMAFMYRKSSAAGTARPFWNCRRFHRAETEQCIPGTE